MTVGIYIAVIPSYNGKPILKFIYTLATALNVTGLI
jgi:hypothetical protein